MKLSPKSIVIILLIFLSHVDSTKRSGSADNNSVVLQYEKFLEEETKDHRDYIETLHKYLFIFFIIVGSG